MDLNSWKTTGPGTLKTDWSEAEKALGFALHEKYKDLYSRITSDIEIDGIMRFDPDKFVKEYVSADDGWLDGANGEREMCDYTLIPVRETGSDYLSGFVKEAFFGEWTGGCSFGRRAYIGELNLNIGQLSLIFNNDTGAFAWVVFEYGYFEIFVVYPYGIVAHSAQEFLDKFN